MQTWTEKGKSVKAHKRNVKVKIKTSDGETYRGKVNLDSESIPMDRLSDLFVKGQNPFIAIYGVTAHGSDRVFVLNKAHIVSVTPDGDDLVEDEAEQYRQSDQEKTNPEK